MEQQTVGTQLVDYLISKCQRQMSSPFISLQFFHASRCTLHVSRGIATLLLPLCLCTSHESVDRYISVRFSSDMIKTMRFT
jgi:predicted MPP superfamily phosphohydrolase